MIHSPINIKYVTVDLSKKQNRTKLKFLQGIQKKKKHNINAINIAVFDDV